MTGPSLSKPEVEQIASEAVRKTLLAIGIDVNDPIEAQRDFAIMREISALARDPEFRKDVEHMRRWRTAMDGAAKKGFLTLVAIAVTGLAAIVWTGFKVTLGK